jgi:hypothetical protein
MWVPKIQFSLFFIESKPIPVNNEVQISQYMLQLLSKFGSKSSMFPALCGLLQSFKKVQVFEVVYI